MKEQNTFYPLKIVYCKTECVKLKSSQDNCMKINDKKSKIMLFNSKRRKMDFPQEYKFSNGQNLEVVQKTKLLGLILTSDLRWEENTLSICAQVMSKMWLLRRMKILKLESDIIFHYYITEIRVLAEQGVAIWNAGLTRSQEYDLEKIQKSALKIILGDEYHSYEFACEKFEIKSLKERRTELCTSFALKLYKSDRSSVFYNH